MQTLPSERENDPVHGESETITNGSLQSRAMPIQILTYRTKSLILISVQMQVKNNIAQLYQHFTHAITLF